MRHRAFIVALICAAPLSAVAATLPIDGAYGNASGCALHTTNNYGEDDSAQILKPDGVATMVTACIFNTVTVLPGGKYRATMTCGFEGSGPEDNYDDTAEIAGSDTKGFSVRFGDGTDWEHLRKC